MRSFSKLGPAILALILLAGCAKQNAGIVKQTYHDLTSHYNGYFNANEQFNLQLKTLQTNQAENYEEILPLFAFGNLEDIKDKNSSLSEAITKARLTIQTHQEKTEGKNYQENEDNSISNWSDDAFLLIGKSYYLQGQLDSAISCFRYITANFDVAVDGRSKKKIKKQKNDKKAKAKAKKKEDKQIELAKDGKDIRPSKKFTLHESAKSEALVWLANSYISNKQYGEAEAILTYIKGDKTFLKNYDTDVALSYAYLYLSQGSLSESESFIESAIENSKGQKNKARLQFILAQIKEKNGDKSGAGTYYKKSIKGNSNFEMVFYAKLKLIQMNRGSKSDNVDPEKLLAKMIRDNKNRNYFDQLYYEKALIALENNDRDDAKKYLNKSVDLSINNPKQKGISYVLLADMYYDEEGYPMSQAYYDSSLSLIPEDYFDYNKVSNRSIVLTDLIENLNTISMNDSLLQLSEMDAKQLESYLYKMAVDQVDAEIKAADKLKQSELIASSATSGKGDKNSWYFYSEASRNSGYKKFKQTWGEIALEDNWRRSDKSSEFNSDSEDDNSESEDEYFTQIDTRYQEMLEAVPNTKEEKDKLKNDVVSSYYNAAIIYKVGLENLPKSIEMFEALNARFPKNKYEPEALYQLYVIHKSLEETPQANEVKNELLTRYPDNKYTAFIKNPEKLKELDKNSEIEAFYEGAYNTYLAEDYDATILKCEEASKKYSNSKLIAKFDLLKAMAIGGKKLYDPFVASLEYVVQQHQQTEEQAKASELLAYLRGEVDEEVETEKPEVKTKGGNTKQSTIQKEEPTEEKEKGGLKLKLGNKELNLGGKKGDKQVPLDEGE